MDTSLTCSWTRRGTWRSRSVSFPWVSSRAAHIYLFLSHTQGPLTHVVVDEAGHMTEPECHKPLAIWLEKSGPVGVFFGGFLILFDNLNFKAKCSFFINTIFSNMNQREVRTSNYIKSSMTKKRVSFQNQKMTFVLQKGQTILRLPPWKLKIWVKY